MKTIASLSALLAGFAHASESRELSAMDMARAPTGKRR